MIGALAFWLALGIVAAVAVPVAVFAVEIVASRFAAPRPAPAAAAAPRIAVLVPAHDESDNLRPTLADIAAQLPANGRVLVVADNCSDDTAAVARACGAEVVERSDPVRRGKGHALDYGLKHLDAAAGDVVIFIDADCRLGPDALRRLAAASLATGRPVQALYRMQAPPGAGPEARFRAFAWAVKNELRPAGLGALGGPCQLMGTGMAVPQARLALADFATGHLAEDLCLGLDFAAHGAPPLFLPEAEVSSTFPDSVEAAASQRRRWEHGHLQLILAEALPRLAEALRRGNWPLAVLTLDLLVPPLTLLVFLAVAATKLAALSILAGAGLWPLAAVVLMDAVFAGTLLVAWRAAGRTLLPADQLAGAAWLALGKAGFYARLLTRGFERRWVRTERDGPER